MLQQTSFAISHDETRYALNGVLFSFSRQGDAPGRHRRPSAGPVVRGRSARWGGRSPGIVPRKAVTEIMRVLGAGEEVQIAITENQFVLQMPNFVMTARLIEGQFPNYEAVIPKGHPGQAGHRAGGPARRRFAASSVMAEERNKPVKLVLAPAALRLTRVEPGSRRGRGDAGRRLRRRGGHDRLQFSLRPRRLAAHRERAGRARIQGRVEPRSGQKRRGRGVLLCYNAHANLAMIFARKMGVLRGCRSAAIQLVDFRNYRTLSYRPASTAQPPYRTPTPRVRPISSRRWQFS